MPKAKTMEEEQKRKIKEYANTLAYFIENPDALGQLQSPVYKEFVEMVKVEIEKRTSENQKQLSISGM